MSYEQGTTDVTNLTISPLTVIKRIKMQLSQQRYTNGFNENEISSSPS
jgi:hypothetical protein